MNGFKTVLLLAAMTALFMGLGYTLGGSGGALIALVAAAAMNLFTFWNADKIVLKMHKAREVDGRTAPELVGIVQQLASRAGLPMPKVYIVDSPHPNAFATGRNPENAAVAATSGLLDILSRDEIAGVIERGPALAKQFRIFGKNFIMLDGRTFRRVHPQTPVISTGEKGMWDANALVTTTSAMQEAGDELRIYYFGCPRVFNSWPAPLRTVPASC